MKVKNRNALIKELVKTADAQLNDEELMHLLLEQRITPEVKSGEKPSLGESAADAVAKFAGSWAFIFSFVGVMALWIALNIIMAEKAFDSYPFILLNLALSCLAAIQAPLIMMSQNRQEKKDRARAESDYRVNLKNELVIADLHGKLDALLEDNKKLEKTLAALLEANESAQNK